MSRRRTNTAEYTRLSTEDQDLPDGFVDEQFEAPPKKFPWKTIIFIMLIMVVGAVCLTLGIMFSSGYFDQKYADRSLPLIILGILMFIPGGYFGYIFLCILLKRDGYTIDDIPML